MASVAPSQGVTCHSFLHFFFLSSSILHNLNLARWRHISNISLLLFNDFLGSASNMAIFSEMHRLQNPAPGRYEVALLLIFQSNSYLTFLSSRSQIWVLNVVWPLLLHLKESVCLPYLCLKALLVRPMYSFKPLSVFTVAE